MQLLRQTDRPRRIGRHRTAAGIGRRLRRGVRPDEKHQNLPAVGRLDAELLRPPVQRPARQIVRQTAAGD